MDLAETERVIKAGLDKRDQKYVDELAETRQRLLDLEQKGAMRPGFDVPEGSGPAFSFAKALTEAPGFENVARGLVKDFAVNVPAFHKAIINSTGSDQPLVAADRHRFVVGPAERRLTLRDLIPTGRTSSNLIEYAKENVFTNSAGPQYASPAYENITKPESNITFTLTSAPVITLAHWIGASRQVLSDSQALAAYIDTRLTYGLKLVEQDAILNGDGTGGTLSGLMVNATAYSGSGAVSADTKIDTLARAIAQLATNEYTASAIVINPIDWMQLRLTKDSQGRYIFGSPGEDQQPSLWGVPIVVTNSMTQTRFLVADMRMAAMLWDREDVTVRVAEQHLDWFVKNMVAILVEERLALTVFRSSALIRGNFVS